jgi:hypothetical protein
VYDGLNRLVRTEHDLTDTGQGTGTVIDTIGTDQAWDDTSRLVGQTDDNGNTTTYAYDALGPADLDHVRRRYRRSAGL